MITKQDAFKIVREKLDAEYDILEESTVEKDYGWIVFPQTKTYINTQNFEEMAVGSGGILVEKLSGRTVQFGSAYPTETNIKIYEAGYLNHDNFDLVITETTNIEEALNLLSHLSIVYVKPEIESDVTWRIPTPFTKSQLRDKLAVLPCKFNLGNLYFKWETLERMKTSSALKYELTANDGFRNEI